MKRGMIALPILGLVIVTMAGNALLLSPQSRERARVREEVATARQEEAMLQASLTELRRLEAEGTTREAELARFGQLVPDTPDLAGFIRTMNDVAAKAQVDWSSLAPSSPVMGVGGAPTTIRLSIQVGGTFFQILDYLKRLENIDRLVVVDSLDVSSSGAGAGGTPKLSVNVQARTFAASGGGAPIAGGA